MLTLSGRLSHLVGHLYFPVVVECPTWWAITVTYVSRGRKAHLVGHCRNLWSQGPSVGTFTYFLMTEYANTAKTGSCTNVNKTWRKGVDCRQRKLRRC